MSVMQLRPQQQSLLEKIDLAIAAGCLHLIAQLPTGGGKTKVAATKTIQMREEGKRVLFTVPALELVDQTVERFWQTSVTIHHDDPVDRWLEARGVGMRNYPKSLRTGMRVRHSGPPISFHPAMLAMVTDATGKPATIHKTYITTHGRKAAVDKVRMFCPGPRPAGGAVRLSCPDDVLGVAEGIETALAAMKLFGVPTWAALDAGGVERFEPPAGIKRLVVFGDNDEHGTGQRAAYALAARLSGQIEIEVRIPEKSDTDWNDRLRAG
jgi:putative DNA primase/helicase